MNALVFTFVGLVVIQALTLLWLVHVKIPRLVRRAAETTRAEQAVATTREAREQVAVRWSDIGALQRRLTELQSRTDGSA